MDHLTYACTLARTDLTVALEFGVGGGDSIRRLRANLPPFVEVHGFDSFEGLPEDWRIRVGDRAGALVGPCAQGFFSTGAVVPNVDDVVFHVGWFADTLPAYLADRDHRRPISLIHVDCDLYSSTRTVLRLLNPLVVAGTVIVFDEWEYHTEDGVVRNDHERAAFLDWTKDFDRYYDLIPYDGGPEADRSPYAVERRIVRITR